MEPRTDPVPGDGGPAWCCLDRARRQQAEPRLPFRVDGRLAGSVAVAHLDALRAWPAWLAVAPGGVDLLGHADERSAGLAAIHRQLHLDGLIRGWRHEPYALLDDSGHFCAVIERAAARFWGSLSFGAHCNGYVARQGRPHALWIARRSLTKPTDPGLLDNLIGGGVPRGQTPLEALRREAWEEAGLRPAQLAGLQSGRVIGLDTDVPEGRQREWLFIHDLALADDCVPSNQDGEVAGFELMPMEQALARAAAGEMTLDASLATLDFALRHGLLGADGPALGRRLDALLVDPVQAERLAAAAAGTP